MHFDRLMSTINPLVQWCLSCEQCADIPSVQQHLAKAEPLIDAAQQHLNEHYATEWVGQKCLYAVIALMDEVTHSHFSDQVHLPCWQYQYFNEQQAGIGFYKALSELRQAPELNLNALGIYYLCLCLGFKGQYQSLSHPKRLKLQHDLWQQIQYYRQSFTQPALNNTAWAFSRPTRGILMPAMIIMMVIAIGTGWLAKKQGLQQGLRQQKKLMQLFLPMMNQGSQL